MSQRIYIEDFEANQLVQGIFAIQNTQLGLTKNGKPFLKCLIADKTGRVAGRMWNASEELIRTLPTNGFVKIEAQTQPYQGEMQLVIQSIFAATPTDADLEHLLPKTKYDVEEMFAEVMEKMQSLKSKPLKTLAEAYLSDEQLMARFKQAPAAMALHHAYLGGLLEHTLSLLRLADAVTPLYPQINRDVVVMGLFLHDLGKCVELTWATGFDYSDEGRLVGHIARGVVWLNDKARELADAGTPLPVECLHLLEHLILSHHGQPEFGALKPPSTPEAILIHMLDNIDAKMQMSLAAARPDGKTPEELGGNFSDKVWALDNVRLYRVDPFAEPPAEPALEKPSATNKAGTSQLTFGSESDGRGGL